MADAASEGGAPYQADDAAALAGELFAGNLTVAEVLAKLRTRLLDLTMRNRLLNYRHPRGRSLQFTDNPDIDDLYERLDEGKAVRLAYVPDPPAERYVEGKKPEARIFAAERGIGTSADIGAGAGGLARGLQVLQYPADLERMARKISSEARTVVEETGTNMLYLMFGFLEYYDREDSESPALAPLLSMPINLARGPLDSESRTYTYEVTYSGEDILENFTLREKLRQHHLVLPDLSEEDSPRFYLNKIKAAIAKQPKWAVRWRLSLGFLSFGKLAIWADLDPAKSENLLKSELLRNIIEGGRSGSSEAFHAEDYDIDRHDDGELPLIYDADSSQHSAIIDVKAGKNLVINGPPGTGKSQTITNIIATAIAARKKVLFVSEKLAALEVVKQRLEKAGLGDFCLEVHSHKTQKKQLLEGVAQRMAGRYQRPAGYAQQLQVLRDRRNALNSYAELLGSRIGNRLDLTVHQVFWTTERRRLALGPLASELAGLGASGAPEWTSEEVERRRRTVADIAGAMKELGGLPKDSPWLGFAPSLLIGDDELPVLRIIDQALVQARRLGSAAANLQAMLGTAPWSVKELAGAADLVGTLQAGTPANGNLLESMFAGGLNDTSGAASDVARLTSMLAQVRRLQALAQDSLAEPGPQDSASFQAHASAARRVLSEDGLLMTPAEIGERTSRALEALANLRRSIADHDTKIPRDAGGLLAELEVACQDPASPAWAGQTCTDLRDAINRTLTTAGEVEAGLTEVEDLLRSRNVPFGGHVDDLRGLIDGRAFPDLVSGAAPSVATIQRLRVLADGGLHDWSAERFASTARELGESLAVARSSSDELGDFFARLGVPVSTSRSGLEGLEVLLAAVEAAPRDLLAMRAQGLERADFADVAIRAEDTLKNLNYRSSKITEAFDLDAMPDDEALRSHLRVFRRGDSAFNFLRSDWRQAKAAFNGCSRKKAKFTASAMADRFSAVLSWRKAVAEFSGSEQFRSTFGPLFDGTRTDFRKVRRLHSWLRTSASNLLATDLGPHVNLASIPEAQLNLLASNVPRVRGWIAHIQKFTTMADKLPGLKPDPAGKRRVEDLFSAASGHAQELEDAAAQLRGLVRPSVTVQRALEVLELHRGIVERGDSIKALIAAPARLAEAAADLGLTRSESAYRQLSSATSEVLKAAAARQKLVESLSNGLGSEISPKASVAVLKALVALRQITEQFLSGSDVPIQGSLLGLLDARAEQLKNSQSLSAYLLPRVKPSVSVQTAVAAIQASLDAVAFLANLQNDQSFVARFGSHLKGADTDEAALHACLQWAKAVEAMAARLPSSAAERLLKRDVSTVASQMAGELKVASEAAAEYAQSLEKLEGWGPLDQRVWRDTPLPSDAVKRLHRAREAASTLVPWSKYLAAKAESHDLGLSGIVELAEQGRLGSDVLPTAFEYVLFRTLSRGILTAHRDLARFTGAGHESLRAEFAEIDRQVIKLNGAVYAAQVEKEAKPLPGVGAGRVGDLTEMALLLKEASKQKRHIPIRQLLKRAGRSIQELKPCFMMGPLSVAQYLEQGHLEFDLLVMDEASQLRPEDALGAVARSKQLVVVGDPKQLPPTNFFDRLMESDDEDPDDAPAVVDGVESILGISEHLFRPVRTLRWHYRSRHESLIAFSNTRFYDRRLVVFPSPHRRNKRLGVNYRYVGEGVYQDRRNVPEAQRVVNAVVEHMCECPDESLGVVTLNQTQRELIEDLLDKASRDIAGVATYLEKHEKAGWKFFVKNLENVQGDERDVIFVSTTFGKPPGSSAVRQTFGPINRPDGWRRLNVLFTRARRRLDLFTSMLPSDVLVDERASLGRRALKEYLEYAKSGVLPGAGPISTGREPDSDFEIAVAEALRQHNYEVEPQVGVAGYFIDLGVRHPHRKGDYLAAIECDGATYHSSLSARDRDRIRQEILESLGWRGRIFRVWSTDWFADPRGQTQKLVGLLKRRLEQDNAEGFEQYEDDPSSDDEPEVLDPVPGDVPNGLPATADGSAAVERTHASDAKPVAFIDIGDRVTYQVMDDPSERHTVHIVDSPSNARLGLLNHETPVAQAMLGLCEGDEGSLRVRGQPARTLRILKVERLQTTAH
ncbi:MAG: DUF4011 domain-containing protein [Rubrivivax sp.]|nr:DUF4011 domain-containing protein [Rubrivivax sp.]